MAIDIQVDLDQRRIEIEDREVSLSPTLFDVTVRNREGDRFLILSYVSQPTQESKDLDTDSHSIYRVIEELGLESTVQVSPGYLPNQNNTHLPQLALFGPQAETRMHVYAADE